MGVAPLPTPDHETRPVDHCRTLVPGIRLVGRPGKTIQRQGSLGLEGPSTILVRAGWNDRWRNNTGKAHPREHFSRLPGQTRGGLRTHSQGQGDWKQQFGHPVPVQGGQRAEVGGEWLPDGHPSLPELPRHDVRGEGTRDHCPARPEDQGGCRRQARHRGRLRHQEEDQSRRVEHLHHRGQGQRPHSQGQWRNHE